MGILADLAGQQFVCACSNQVLPLSDAEDELTEDVLAVHGYCLSVEYEKL